MNELFTNLLDKLKTFVEIAFTLVLDLLLTILLWWIRTVTDNLTGFSEQKQNDQLYKWVITLAELGTYIALSCYVIFDIYSQALKTFRQIRRAYNSTP